MVKFCINTEDFDISTASGLIWELKDLIACNFSSVNLGFTMDTISVRDSIPSCIHNLVAKDLAQVKYVMEKSSMLKKTMVGGATNVKIAVIPYPSHSKFVEQILNMAKSW